MIVILPSIGPSGDISGLSMVLAIRNNSSSELWQNIKCHGNVCCHCEGKKHNFRNSHKKFHVIYHCRFPMLVLYPLLRIESTAFMAEVLKHMKCNLKVCGLATWSAN